MKSTEVNLNMIGMSCFISSNFRVVVLISKFYTVGDIYVTNAFFFFFIFLFLHKLELRLLLLTKKKRISVSLRVRSPKLLNFLPRNVEALSKSSAMFQTHFVKLDSLPTPQRRKPMCLTLEIE